MIADFVPASSNYMYALRRFGEAIGLFAVETSSLSRHLSDRYLSFLLAIPAIASYSQVFFFFSFFLTGSGNCSADPLRGDTCAEQPAITLFEISLDATAKRHNFDRERLMNFQWQDATRVLQR